MRSSATSSPSSASRCPDRCGRDDMDFSLTDDQKSLRALAREILVDGATHAHLQQLEKESWAVFGGPLGQKLPTAGITGIAVPEEQGGGGLGFLELSIVFEEIGRSVAPVPAVPPLVTPHVSGLA